MTTKSINMYKKMIVSHNKENPNNKIKKYTKLSVDELKNLCDLNNVKEIEMKRIPKPKISTDESKLPHKKFIKLMSENQQ